MLVRRFIVLLLIFFLSIFSAYSQSSKINLNIPDNSPVRMDKMSFLIEDISKLKNSIELTSNILVPFRIRFEVLLRGNEVKYLFINEKDKNPNYNLVSPGSYIISRSLLDGQIKNIQVYLTKDPEIYVNIKPNDDRSSFLNLHIFDNLLPFQENVKIPFSINEVIYEDFNSIVEISNSKVSWKYVKNTGDQLLYEPIIAAAGQVFNRIKNLPYSSSSDGVIDSNGKIVSYSDPSKELNTLGDFGISKWIVDGFYKPKRGRNISLEDMKIDMIPFRGGSASLIMNERYNIYRSLDFTRSLSTAYKIYPGSNRQIEAVESDIRSIGFFSYEKNIGFKANDLKKIAYILSVEKPWSIYLLSLSKPYTNDRSFLDRYKAVALFSWIDREGNFQTLVIDGQKTYFLDTFINLHKDEFVHISYIDISSEKFELEEFN